MKNLYLLLISTFFVSNLAICAPFTKVSSTEVTLLDELYFDQQERDDFEKLLLEYRPNLIDEKNYCSKCEVDKPECFNPIWRFLKEVVTSTGLTIGQALRVSRYTDNLIPYIERLEKLEQLVKSSDKLVDAVKAARAVRLLNITMSLHFRVRNLLSNAISRAMSEGNMLIARSLSDQLRSLDATFESWFNRMISSCFFQ